MSGTDPLLTHDHTKKKRRRDEARDDDASLAGEPKKKKNRKHAKESDVLVPPTLHGDSDSQSAKNESVATDTGGGQTPSEKKKKRKRGLEGLDTAAEATTASDKAPDATEGRKKKKKQRERGDVPPNAEPQPPALPKKKKPKEKEKASISADIPYTVSDSAFPLPSDISYQPNAFFPSLNNISFPELNFDSNEDILRAFQNVDLSSVLKTLSDAADAANVPLGGIASSSTNQPTDSGAPAESGGVSKPKKQKHRRTLDMNLPSSSSDPQTKPDHALLLTTKWMSTNQLADLVKSEGLVYKKGKFSAIEAKQINEAIENYRTSRALSEDAIEQLIFPTDEKQKDTAFWTEITSAVAQRPIVAVYHYVRRARHPLKGQGKWSAEEDVKLIQAVTSLGQQWQKVAALVGRMPTDCRDRYRNHIVDREKRLSGAWSPEEEAELTRIVTEMQEGKDPDHDIFWTRVAELMGGTRSRQQCRIKWTDSLSKKYKGKGDTGRWSTQDALILIRKIDALKVRDDTEIDWKAVPDPEWNLWSAHTLQRRWLTMKKGVKGFEDMTHPEIMDILRLKFAEIPQNKLLKSTAYADDGSVAGSSAGPGTLAGKSQKVEEDDSS